MSRYAQIFRAHVEHARRSHRYGAVLHVYTRAEYADMFLYLTPDQEAGFAIKPDGDIVSLFSAGGGRVQELLRIAIALGGRKLDAFDTDVLQAYRAAGFREVSRVSWNEEYKPRGWNKTTFARWNNGEPDVVYMEYAP